jgi:putative peptidoglycan lipid II flippase
MAGIARSVLNSLGHFAVPALSPILFNVFMIVSIFVLTKRWGIYGVAIGVLCGMATQFLVQIPVLVKKRMKYTFVFDFKHPAVEKMLKLSIPMFFYLIIAYLSPTIEKMFASGFEQGAVSTLMYAFRIFSLPNTLISSSIGIVLLPVLSKYSIAEEKKEFRENTFLGLRAIIFLMVPVTVLMILLSSSIVQLFYRHGNFCSDAVPITAAVFKNYAVGLVAVGLGQLLLNTLYAMQDTKCPLFVELINLCIYIPLAYMLSYWIKLPGLALARAFSFWLVAVFLLSVVHRKVHVFDARQFFPYVLKIIVGAGGMGIVCKLILNSLNQIGYNSFVWNLVIITIIVGVGTLIYGLICYFLGIKEVRSFIGFLSR